jgi:hypothetical protein
MVFRQPLGWHLWESFSTVRRSSDMKCGRGELLTRRPSTSSPAQQLDDLNFLGVCHRPTSRAVTGRDRSGRVIRKGIGHSELGSRRASSEGLSTESQMHWSEEGRCGLLWGKVSSGKGSEIAHAGVGTPGRAGRAYCSGRTGELSGLAILPSA